jgi:hypothetical protein
MFEGDGGNVAFGMDALCHEGRCRVLEDCKDGV